MLEIIGHWLMTTAHYDSSTGQITPVLALDVVPWSAWLDKRLGSPAILLPPGAARLIGGAIAAGLGITLAILIGFDGNLVSAWNTGIIAMMLGGAWVCGVSPRVKA